MSLEKREKAVYCIGIDMGSTSTKLVVTDPEGEIILRDVQPTGWSSVRTSQEIREKLEKRGIDPEENLCVATGYGRVSVPFADRTVTEITCHARGAMELYGFTDATLIDIGGQDTKIICIREGAVKDFVMNDRCSAGTGRFLEVMSASMGLDPAGLCSLAELGGGIRISSLCTVFAESEVISLMGRGESRENIAHAVVDSISERVVSLSARMNPVGERVYLTGGLCECDYMRQILGEKLHCEVYSSPDGRYAGALGAAVTARSMGGRS